MSAKKDKPIADLLRRLAHKHGYGPRTPEEAQAEYEAAEPEELPQGLAQRIAKAVATGKKPKLPQVVPSFLPELEDAPAEDESLAVLNRNRGEEDPETTAKLEELRRKALEEEDDDNDEGEDAPRLED